MTCIFCRRTDNLFNVEHVFPESIGGAITIKEVCKVCNQLLSKMIDDPFVRLPNLLALRQLQALSRGKRDIPSPFGKERFLDLNDNEYHVVKSENWYEARYSMQQKVVETSQGPAIQVVVSKKFIKEESLDVFIREQIAQVEKKYNVRVDRFEVSESDRTPVFPSVSLKHNTILLGCLKIAYELACVTLPSFFFDAQAPIYAEMLLKGKLDPRWSEFLTPDSRLSNLVFKRVGHFPFIWNFDCFCVLQNIEGFGFVASVKVFNLFHNFILSRQTNHFDDRQLLFLNDSQNKRFACTFYKRPTSFTFSFNIEELSVEQKEVLQKESRIFQSTADTIPMYDSNGHELFAHIEALWGTTLVNQEWALLAHLQQLVIQLDGSFFLKEHTSGFLFAPSSVTFFF